MGDEDVTRLLTDEGIPVGWARAINKVAAIEELGLRLDVTSVHEIGRSGLTDKEQLIFARNNGYVLMTCDRYRHRDGQELRAEFASHGGRIIQIRGGPTQPIQEAVAKFLINYGKWEMQHSKVDGITAFQGANPFRFRSPEQFTPSLSYTGDQQLTGYESRPAQPRRSSRRVNPPHDQGELMSELPDEA